MKRILIPAILIASSSAFAAGVAPIASMTADANTQVCNGTSNSGKTSVLGGSGAIPPAGTTLVFTRSGFDIQCSANVFMSIQESSANLAMVGSGSAKGNQSFAGHTNGGAIKAMRKCTKGGANNACGNEDVNDAISEAKTASSATGT